MDKLKQWVTFTVLGAVVLLAAGWLLLISPKNSEATDLGSQVDTQVSANGVLQTQLQVLRTQAKELPKKQAELARVAAKIPDNPALPALIRALTAASTSAGVEFVSITPGAPVPAAAAVATPVAPGTPVTAAPAAGGSAGQLAAVPVTLNVVGDYFEVEQFLANLEALPRALRVTNLILAPGSSAAGATGTTGSSAAMDGRTLTSTITGSVFLAANRPVATAVVAPGQAATGVAPALPAPTTTVAK